MEFVGELAHCLSLDVPVSSLAVSADGSVVVSCCGTRILVWRTVQGFQLQWKLNETGSTVHKKKIRSCALSADSAWLVTPSMSEPCFSSPLIRLPGLPSRCFRSPAGMVSRYAFGTCRKDVQFACSPGTET
jgi:hypothetical protein